MGNKSVQDKKNVSDWRSLKLICLKWLCILKKELFKHVSPPIFFSLCLHVGSLMTSQELLQRLCLGMWTQFHRGRDEACLYVGERTSAKCFDNNKKKKITPRDELHNLHWSVCLSLTHIHKHAHDKLSFLLVRKRRECERKQDQAREGQAVTEPRTSLHWHHSD